MNILLLRRRALRLPYSLNMALLPDGAVPGWLGSATVAAGVASVVPTAGADVVVNGNMETGDPPSNWTANGSETLDGVADERTGGAGVQSLDVLLNGANAIAYQAFAASTGTWYSVSGWKKNVTTNTVIGIGTSRAGVQLYNLSYTASPAWAQVNGAFRATAATLYATVAAISGAPANGRFDDISVMPLTLSTLFSGPALRLGRADVRVRAAWTGTAGTQFGVAIVDHPTSPTCGILVYHNGVNLLMEKFTAADTWTSLINVAAAYGAGRAVELWRSGTTVQAWYNDAQIGTDQTVSDANILACRYATLFSTYDGNTASQFNVEAA